MYFLSPRRETTAPSPASEVAWQEEVDPLEPVVDQALERIDALERSLKAGEQEHAAMRHRLDRLERQLGVLLAAQTEGRRDLAGSEHSRHQQLARQYRTLIEQNFLNFARRYADKSDLVMDRSPQERTAYMIRQLSRQFFTENLQPSWAILRNLHLPEGDGHIESGITAIRGHCSELARQIFHAGLNHTWDFSDAPGTALDLARQEVWPACNPRSPVAFVMSPAYVVDGRTFCPQYVYSTS